MSANIIEKPNVYETYPNMYQQPSMFASASNDLAGNRAMLESNLVGGGEARRKKRIRSRKTRVGGGKQQRKSSSRRKRGTRKSFYQLN